MNTQLSMPPDIKVIQDDLESIRYILPRRKLGRLRWLGLVPAIIGLGLSGFMFTWMSGPLAGLGSEHGAGKILSIVFALLGLPGMLLGIGMILFGIIVMLELSHAEIALADGCLRATERFGLLRWTRKYPLDTLYTLDCICLNGPRLTQPSSNPNDFTALRAVTNATNMLVAIGYPSSLLVPMTTHLATILTNSRLAPSFDPNLNDEDASEEEENAPGTGTTSSSDPDDNTLPDEQITAPAKTNITVQHIAQGVAITIPPSGFKSASSTFLLAGLLFAAIPSGILWGALSSKDKPAHMGILFLAVFILAGVAMILHAINLSRSRTLLAVTDDSLAFRTKGPFRSVEKIVPRRDIMTVGLGPSGVEVNDVPVMQLQIFLPMGKTIGLLSQRPKEELVWLAAVLRRALKVGKELVFENVNIADKDVPKPPKSSITIQEQTGGGIAISIPRPGLLKGSKGLFAFSLFWNGFIAVFITLMARSGAHLGEYLFILIFVAVGLATMAGAINMGWKRILLAVSSNTLSYQTIGPFGTVRKQLRRQEIESIIVGPSGMSSGNVPVMELQIRLAGHGEKIGLMSQCAPEEAAWVAALLRSRLNMSR